jgi:hypothetical protein
MGTVMGILLLVAVLVVALAVVYVAASFDVRITRKVDPLLERAVREISEMTGTVGGRSERRIEAIGVSLGRDLSRTSAELKQATADLGAQLSERDRRLAAELADLTETVRRITAVQVEADRSQQETGAHVVEMKARLMEIKDAATELELHREDVAGIVKTGTAQSARDLQVVRSLLGQLSEEQARAHSRLTEIGQALARHGAEAAVRGEGHHQWAAEQMLMTARHLQALLDGQVDVASFLRVTLDDESRSGATDGRGRRVIWFRLPEDGPDDDVFRELAAAFCQQFGLTQLLSAAPGAARSGAYYVWRSHYGVPLEEVLAALLTACPDHAVSSPAGLEELRGLLLALHSSGRGTIRIGPLILVSAGRALLGGVVNAEEADRLRAVMSPEDTARLVRALGYDRVVEMTEWASGYFAEP